MLGKVKRKKWMSNPCICVQENHKKEREKWEEICLLRGIVTFYLNVMLVLCYCGYKLWSPRAIQRFSAVGAYAEMVPMHFLSVVRGGQKWSKWMVDVVLLYRANTIHCTSLLWFSFVWNLFNQGAGTSVVWTWLKTDGKFGFLSIFSYMRNWCFAFKGNYF